MLWCPQCEGVDEWRPIPPKDPFVERPASSSGTRAQWNHLIATAKWWGWGRILTGALCIPLVGFGGYFLLRSPEAPVEASLTFATTIPSSNSTLPLSTTPAATQVTVHVAGNVVAPGVYRFASGSRVVDAVRSAGGASSTADLNAINLAGLLKDGEQVYVPAIGEPRPTPDVATNTTEAIRLPLDLNTASVDELDVLPGIGPTTAAAIVAHRDQHGPFVSVEELLEVAGIGPAKLAALSGLIRV